jgi:PRTRC genetic system protein B
MNTPITNITEQFGQVYFPVNALLFYRHALNNEEVYIEKLDCNRRGRLINAHPLSEREIGHLAALFRSQQKQKDRYLTCDGLLPDYLLYLNAASKTVMWYTPKQCFTLYFTKSLHLKNGEINLPALIWKATASELFVFAAAVPHKPTVNAELFYAPFYNLHDNGRVCMGTVQVDMTHCKNVEELISAWQGYFFNSKFSHLISEQHPTKTPLGDLYQQLMASQRPFPEKELRSTGKTLQQLIP